MIEVYKILNEKENIDKERFFQKLPTNITNCEDMKLNEERSRLELRLQPKSHHFLEHHLLEVVNVETVNNVKNAYDCYRKEMDTRRI